MKTVEQEIWKDIDGYQGYYEISNLGRVRSNKRVVRGRGIAKRVHEAKFRKICVDVYGYHNITLCKKSEKKTFRVHKLVAQHFLGHVPNGHAEVVDHINNIQADNRASNLQLITQRENTTKDKFRHNPTSKYVGVSWQKTIKKWRAVIIIGGKAKYLGVFEDELAASDAYNTKLKEINNGL